MGGELKSPAHVVEARRLPWYCLATENRCNEIEKEKNGEVSKACKYQRLLKKAPKVRDTKRSRITVLIADDHSVVR